MNALRTVAPAPAAPGRRILDHERHVAAARVLRPPPVPTARAGLPPGERIAGVYPGPNGRPVVVTG